MKWKPNWAVTKQHMTDFWNRKGLALWISCRADKPVEHCPKPPAPPSVEFGWTDAVQRHRDWESWASCNFFGSDHFPYFDTQIGPGSLGTFIGSKPNFVPGTVWYEPCITDPDNSGVLKFDPNDHWFKVHMALIEEGVRHANGRYLVGIPDLIENLDTLAALRGSEELLMDLIERPEWVHARLAEINQVYFDAFDVMFNAVKDLPESGGGNAFSAFGIWGPGKTAKLQCDFAAMISAKMFNDFVVPPLARQCEWLDYSMFHWDGTTALQHEETLLGIDALDAIEWTPQAGIEGGGNRRWYDLYRRIKKGGKSVQAVGVTADEMIPLIDAVGPEGLFILGTAPDQKTAEKVMKQAEQYGWRGA